MDQKKAKTILNFQGLISAPFTALTPDGAINPNIIEKYIDHLVSQGVKGAFVNGTTGEGLSLTVEERKTVAEEWVKHGKGKLEVIIIQIGANSLKDAQELASHAEKIGATGIASLPPLFYKPSNHDQLINYLKQISKAAPTLPIMLYHFPDMSGVQISVSDFLPKARQEIPTFIGAKFTSIDVRDLTRCHIITQPKFKIIPGYEDVLLPSLTCGATAAIGATFNFMGPLCLKIVDAFQKGNIEEARKYQNEVVIAIKTITRHGQGIACYKAVMNLLGPLDFGPSRSPVDPLDSKALADLKEDLKNLKAKEWSKP